MYVQKLIEAFHPFGEVLEVGFGPCTKEIQKYRPKSHTILSTDPEAASWAKKYPGTAVIPETWASALERLGVFDAIFFGIDPAENPFFTRMRYTETDLDFLCRTVAEKGSLSRFLEELEQNGQISAELKEKMVHKYKLPLKKAPPFKRSQEMLEFLKLCLSSHMRVGSRFSCYLKSELDDPEFFNQIVVDPFLDCHQEERIVVIQKLG